MEKTADVVAGFSAPAVCVGRSISITVSEDRVHSSVTYLAGGSLVGSLDLVDSLLGAFNGRHDSDETAGGGARPFSGEKISLGVACVYTEESCRECDTF